MKVAKVRLSTLVLDHEWYPRHKVDSTTVRRYADALRAGVVLPPLRVEERTHLLVNGFHRYYACVRVYGLDAEVDCELSTYASEAERYLDAVTPNTTHGRPFAIFDKVRAYTIGHSRYKLTDDTLAQALQVSAERLHGMCERIAHLNGHTAKTRSGVTVVMKRTAIHLGGKTITPRQATANARANGLPQLYLIRQVINLIEGDLLDVDNPRLQPTLDQLTDLLAARRRRGNK